jgi:hypothetical protein
MARKAHTDQDEAGFVTSRRNPLTRGQTVLYDGDEAGLDTEDGRWSMFCREHGALVPHTNRAKATKLLRSPQDWCPQCANLAKTAQEPTPQDLEREMRFWAAKARHDPEKEALFEKMYGVGPETYWD